MTPNRIVAVLTPLVFAPAAGAVAAWVAKHAPGVDLSANELQNIFIAGALIALAPAAQWLHGWQKYEDRQAQGEQAIELAAASAALPFAAEEFAPGEPEDEELVEEEGEDDGEMTLDELDELVAAGDEDEDEDPLIAGSPLPAGTGG